jgi:hypothetical protein
MGADLQQRLICHYALSRVTEDTVDFYGEVCKGRGSSHARESTAW